MGFNSGSGYRHSGVGGAYQEPSDWDENELAFYQNTKATYFRKEETSKLGDIICKIMLTGIIGASIYNLGYIAYESIAPLWNN